MEIGSSILASQHFLLDIKILPPIQSLPCLKMAIIAPYPYLKGYFSIHDLRRRRGLISIAKRVTQPWTMIGNSDKRGLIIIFGQNAFWAS
jgi:hypothetical protein